MQKTGAAQSKQTVRYRGIGLRKGFRKYWMLYAIPRSKTGTLPGCEYHRKGRTR